MTSNIGSTGYALLRNPHTNKRTAFSDEDGEILVLKVCCRQYPRRSTTR
jgi:hypothetical protein